MLKNLFKKSEKKSYSSSLRSFFTGVSSDFDYSCNVERFIEFYTKNSPVFIATKMISEAISAIDIVVKDKRSDEIVGNHPINKLLEKPNPFTYKRLFIEEIISYYVLTGNVYLETILAGRKSEPKELTIFNPLNVTIQANDNDGYAQKYRYQALGRSIEFTRDANKDFEASNGNKLGHLRDFNPNFNNSNLVGVSRFAGCQLEISQHILSSVHNNSILENQARPSGFLTYKGDAELSDDQINQLQGEIQSKFKGAANAGRASFLNGHFDWVRMSESVKDMDFESLQKRTAQTIFNAAKIPLPLISPDNMTLSNFSEAKYIFYDNCLLPLLKRILNFLDEEVLSKYSNSENFYLSYDESAIECLEERKFKNSIDLFKSYLITRDEGRALVGYGETEGGDVFYQPSTLIPAGSDNNVEKSEDQSSTDEAKQEYIRLMSNYKDNKGNNIYSKEFVEKRAKEIYG